MPLHCTLYANTWKLDPVRARAFILILFTTPLLKGVENLEQIKGHIVKIINVWKMKREERLREMKLLLALQREI